MIVKFGCSLASPEDTYRTKASGASPRDEISVFEGGLWCLFFFLSALGFSNVLPGSTSTSLGDF